MNECKPVSTSVASHFKFSSQQCPRTEDERVEMNKVTYSSAVRSHMYAKIGTRPDLAHSVSVVSRYMVSPGKQL